MARRWPDEDRQSFPPRKIFDLRAMGDRASSQATRSNRHRSTLGNRITGSEINNHVRANLGLDVQISTMLVLFETPAGYSLFKVRQLGVDFDSERSVSSTLK